MSASIYDVSSMYDTYSQTLGNTSASSAANALNLSGEDSTDEELMEACKEFEEYFVEKIIAQARKSISMSEDEDGEYMKYFGDMLNQSYAEAVADGDGVGLAQQLYESMKRNMG